MQAGRALPRFPPLYNGLVLRFRGLQGVVNGEDERIEGNLLPLRSGEGPCDLFGLGQTGEDGLRGPRIPQPPWAQRNLDTAVLQLSILMGTLLFGVSVRGL